MNTYQHSKTGQKQQRRERRAKAKGKLLQTCQIAGAGCKVLHTGNREGKPDE